MSTGLLLVVALALSFTLSLILTPLVERFANRAGAVDRPSSEERRIHTRAVTRWGGVGVFAAFTVTTLVLLPFSGGHRHYGALIIGGAIMLVVGGLDDLRRIWPGGISASWKLLWQIVAVALVVALGVGVHVITNPFGGVFQLDSTSIDLFGLGHLPFLAVALTVVWILLIVNTMNFLDGLDGLATGVGGISALVIAGLSLSVAVHQPATAVLAVALGGAALGFLPYNFNPARVFLGDSGAYFMGFVLAVLAIISGGKIATAVLVLGFPLLDTVWTVLRRLAQGRSPFSADRHHLHHRLLDVGLSQRNAVYLMYLFSMVFGGLAVLSTSRQKLLLFVVLAALMITLLASVLVILHFRRPAQKRT